MKKQKAKERIKINGPKIKETAAAFIFLFLYFIMALLLLRRRRPAAAKRRRIFIAAVIIFLMPAIFFSIGVFLFRRQYFPPLIKINASAAYRRRFPLARACARPLFFINLGAVKIIAAAIK